MVKSIDPNDAKLNSLKSPLLIVPNSAQENFTSFVRQVDGYTPDLGTN